jgi:hypothetical protein
MIQRGELHKGWPKEPEEDEPAPFDRQYVAIRFHSRDRKTYAYHNDGPPVQPGDHVQVPGRSESDGWKSVEVVSVTDEPPAFTTKPIMQESTDDAR